MIYPLFKRFIDKGMSMASSDRGTGYVDSHGYRLGSYNRSGQDQQSKRAKLSNHDPTLDTIMGHPDTKWGSEERIVGTTRERAAGSSASDEESSIQGPSMAPKTSTAVHGPSAASMNKENRWTSGGRDIMVTTEYSVSVDEEAARHQRRGAKSPQPQ